MTCPSCGHRNIEGARFCAQCGTALRVACPSCGTPNDPGSQFCTNCGTRLAPPAGGPAARPDGDLARYVPDELLRRMRAAQAGGAMHGERRTVTMLFADIEGSTAAAERLDPEEWAEIANGAFEQLIAPIYRYEGTVARLLGDAILAFFGAPIAHEDDPVRAVRAGLEILESIAAYRASIEARAGVPIGVRVGINTGLVVVGEVGSDLRVEYTALGDAINLAARMEQTAEAGTVRITEHTANLLGGMFELADIGPVEVKGKAEPVRAFRVLGAAKAGGGRRDTGRLVGRDRERAALESVVARLLDGIGGICSLVGEAGIGKSRLLSVLRAAVETRTVVATASQDSEADLAWLDGRSRSFDTSVPYSTFAEALRRWWGLDAAPADQAWDRIAAAMQRASGSVDPDAASFLATAVGAPVPAQHSDLITGLPTPVLHQRTTDALSAYLEAEAAGRPVLLVLDDLHWGDALSLALVERLMGLTDTAALGLLIAMRPYPDDASWRLLERASRDYGHRYTRVQLDALKETAARDLLEALLGGTRLGEPESRQILERANGNPLFMEELARSLGDAAERDARIGPLGRRIDIPASLTGLLTARLDQLDDSARLVAQVASVIGAEFTPARLASLLDDVDAAAAAAELVRRGILVERRRIPEPVYAFRHALIEETAYSTVLLRTRRQLHGRLARHLECVEPEAIHQIARHHLESDDREQAFPYLVEAGEQATRAMALSDAIQLFTTALDAVPTDADPDAVVRAHAGLGEAYGLIPDLPHATAIYQQLFDYGASRDRPSVQVTALNRLGLATATHSGDFTQAEKYLAEARRIAESAGDHLGLAEYHMNACTIASVQGMTDRAIEHDAETARLGEEQGSERIRLIGLERRALNLIITTQYAEGELALEHAIEVAEELRSTETLAALRTVGGGQLALRDGDLARAQQILAEGLPTLDRFGSMHGPQTYAEAAYVAMEVGDVEGALARAARGLRLGQQYNYPFGAAVAAASMARAYAVSGLRDPVEELRATALTSLAAPTGEYLASSAWAELGWSKLALDAFSDASEDFSVGLSVSSASRFWQRPRLLIGAALASLGQADAPAARALLDEASTYVAERSIRLHDTALALCEGLLAMAEERFEESEAALARAQTLAVERGQRLLERDIAAARGHLARASGRPDEAALHLEHGRRLAEGIAAMIADEQVREAFVARSADLLEHGRPVAGL